MKYRAFIPYICLMAGPAFCNTWLLSTSYPSTGPAAGGELRKYKVNCEEEASTPQLVTGKHAFVLTRYPSTPTIKGEIHFLTGGTGEEPYHNDQVRAQTVNRLLLEGFITRVVYWTSPWFKNTGGVGFKRSACLYGNLAEHLHSLNPSLPLGAVGNSGGAMQIVGAVFNSRELQSIMKVIIPTAFPSLSINAFCYGFYLNQFIHNLMGPSLPTGTRTWHDWANGYSTADLNRPDCYNFVNTSSPVFGVLPSQSELDRADLNAFIRPGINVKNSYEDPFPKVFIAVSNDDLGPKEHSEELFYGLIGDPTIPYNSINFHIGPPNGHKFDAHQYGQDYIVDRIVTELW